MLKVPESRGQSFCEEHFVRNTISHTHPLSADCRIARELEQAPAEEQEVGLGVTLDSCEPDIHRALDLVCDFNWT